MRRYISKKLNRVIEVIKQSTQFRRFTPDVETETVDTIVSVDANLVENLQPSWREIADYLKTLIVSKENTPLIIIATMLTLVSVALNYLVPLLTSKAFDSSEQEPSTLKNDLIFATALFILSQVIPHFREQLLTSISANTTKKILTETARKSLLEKDLKYHNAISNEDKTFKLNKGFAVSNTIEPLLTQILPTLLEISIASALVSTKYDFKAGIFLSLMFASSIGFGAKTSTAIIKASRANMDVGRKTWSMLSEIVTNHKTIHDCRNADSRLKQAYEQMDATSSSRVALYKTQLYGNRGQVFIAGLFVITTLLFTDCTSLSKKDLFILATYLQQFIRLVPSFGETITRMMASYPDLKFAIGELMQPSLVKDEFSAVKFVINEKHHHPSIEFQNVSFSYGNGDKSKVVLKNASFKIEAGQRVALVSESGKGKSTLFNLLYRYYEPQSGTIIVAGQDIQQVGLESLRDRISIVEQSPVLFGKTLRENLCAEHKSFSDIRLIAQYAGLLEFVDNTFKEGLDTETGQNGSSLSGGQKQKVAILRTLLRDEKILLLDEATSALDAQSARQFMERIDVMSDKTIFAITHKLKEVQDFDSIIVLNDDGSVTQGKHAELLRNNSVYQMLWRSQASQVDDAHVSSCTDSVAGRVMRDSVSVAVLAHRGGFISKNTETQRGQSEIHVEQKQSIAVLRK